LISLGRHASYTANVSVTYLLDLFPLLFVACFCFLLSISTFSFVFGFLAFHLYCFIVLIRNRTENLIYLPPLVAINHLPAPPSVHTHPLYRNRLQYSPSNSTLHVLIHIIFLVLDYSNSILSTLSLPVRDIILWRGFFSLCIRVPVCTYAHTPTKA